MYSQVLLSFWRVMLDCIAQVVVPDVLTYHLAAAVLVSNAISPFLLLKVQSEVSVATADSLSVKYCLCITDMSLMCEMYTH